MKYCRRKRELNCYVTDYLSTMLQMYHTQPYLAALAGAVEQGQVDHLWHLAGPAT